MKESCTVVVAPDSFKGSLSAPEVADAISAGWRSERPEDTVILLPQADGGEGTLDAVERSVRGAVRRSAGTVTGPDRRPANAEWLVLPQGIAVVEFAVTSGLALMRNLDPMHATSRGLGEVIAAALASGARSLVIALGGSASTDGGMGALSALGLRLLDAGDNELPDGGGALSRLARIDASALIRPPAGGVTLLTDVTAPLLGPAGAAAVFGPQKGASSHEVRLLDSALARLCDVTGGDPATPGVGAAGGTAFGFAEFWGARIVSGAEYVATLSGLDPALDAADVLITGEGRFDAQSLTGKVVGNVLERARARGIVAHVVAGQVDLHSDRWTQSLVGLSGSTAAAMADPDRWLRVAGAAAAVEYSRRIAARGGPTD
ncbi:MAG: glycerate kinase [Salinibacterium sp.]|nr:glycerate kinase [Salinibacterium sp.]